MVNCNFENFGCIGGYLTNTIDYLQTEGLVASECVKYQEAVGMCSYRCDEGASEIAERYYCKVGSMKIATTFEEIMEDLYKHGPMMVGMMIYEDFMNYESGIYKQITGDVIGGHAMKLLGYGHDEVEGLYWEL
jgi:cathepsin B